jgi:transposase
MVSVPPSGHPADELLYKRPVLRANPERRAEKIALMWAQERSKEGWKIDRQKLLPRQGFEVLPGRWVVEWTFSWFSQNRRTSTATGGCAPPLKRSSMWR